MSTLMRILPRLALVLMATIFMASLAFAGALLALVYAGWSLLRGRKPQWPTIFMGPLRHMHRRSEPRWHARSGDAGVIEGQAREL